MSKLLRSLHIMNYVDKEIHEVLHSNILQSLQHHSVHIDNNDLYDIFLTMNITRSGSREMYKTLEYIINIRLVSIGEDNDLLNKFFATANKSGLLSQETILRIANLL